MKKLLAALCFALLLSGTQILFAQEKDKENRPGKTISGGVLNGNAISLPAPKYPKKAKEKKIEGTVTVQVIINKKGLVESAKVTSGHPDLREASTVAALQSKFKPTLLKDKPVKVRGVIVYNFGPKPKGRRTTPRYFDRDILNSRALKLPAPSVTEQARKNCLSGYVEVSVTLDSRGYVTSAKAVKGHPILRESSEKAAMKSKFKTQESSGTIIYNFDFSENCKK